MVNKEELIKIVMNSFSYANVCRNIGVSSVGGNFNTVKKYIKLYNINIDHFTGQCWNTGDKYKFNGKIIQLEEILKGEHPDYKSSSLRIRLIRNDIKENKCEMCGIVEWNNAKISLHLHHIDGDNTNHKLENLKILCPNCHSQTDTFGAKNSQKENNYSKIELLTTIYDSKNYTEVKKKLNLSRNGDNNFIKNILFEYNVKFTEKEKIQNIILEEIRLDRILKMTGNYNKYYCKCGKEILKNSKMCPVCDKIKQRKVENRPSLEILLNDVSKTNYTLTGKKYGVSDNCIKKWIKKYGGVPPRKMAE